MDRPSIPRESRVAGRVTGRVTWRARPRDAGRRRAAGAQSRRAVGIVVQIAAIEINRSASLGANGGTCSRIERQHASKSIAGGPRAGSNLEFDRRNTNETQVDRVDRAGCGEAKGGAAGTQCGRRADLKVLDVGPREIAVEIGRRILRRLTAGSLLRAFGEHECGRIERVLHGRAREIGATVIDAGAKCRHHGNGA